MVWVDPFDEMRRMQREMDRMFSDVLRRPEMQSNFGSESGWREPLADMWETDDAVFVTLELPGVSKDDIKLNITENQLEVSVDFHKEEKEEKSGYKRFERQYRGFYRAVSLPAKVIPDKAEATYKNGVLEIKLPKAEKKKGVQVKVK
ncbi:MAG: Hsp20/alpha crystallin family protein [Candidatus Diapherotrites archaeon]|nr:Hsp20/alpha crystallin family protein [Candidatus Diapherotrites archaeon]